MIPKISVVIPAHNEEKYISVCLSSLKHQIYTNFEIIVVDNASTDRTAQIARLFADKVIFEPVCGVARARQAGFEAAHGEVIVSADADTLFESDWLLKIARKFDEDDELIALCGHMIFYDGDKLSRWITARPFRYVMSANYFLGLRSFFGCNFAVRKEYFKKCGGFNLRMNQDEDLELAQRLKKLGKIEYCPDIMAYTSVRRFKANPLEFLWIATMNFFRVMFKTGDIVNNFKVVR
ncbi:MAG: glycosyltransferase [Actinobacteria bacterium]|nr:glycosyltransferase [Actinomycetota bacterium]